MKGGENYSKEQLGPYLFRVSVVIDNKYSLVQSLAFEGDWNPWGAGALSRSLLATVRRGGFYEDQILDGQ